MHWPEPGLPSDDSSPASWTQYILPALPAFSCIPVEKKVLTWMIKVQMIKLRSQDQARAEPRLPESRLIEGSGSRVIPTSQPQPRCLCLPTKGPQAWQPFVHVSHPGPIQLQRVHVLSLLSSKFLSTPSYPLSSMLKRYRAQPAIPAHTCTISCLSVAPPTGERLEGTDPALFTTVSFSRAF